MSAAYCKTCDTYGSDPNKLPRCERPDCPQTRLTREVQRLQGAPMTKPVQIQPVAWMVHNAPDTEGNDEPYTNWSRVKVLMDEGYEVTPLIPETAVRSLLEAKAREWQERDIREYQECQELNARMLRGEVVTMTASIGYVGCPSPNRHVAELLSLAATLGNQGK